MNFPHFPMCALRLTFALFLVFFSGVTAATTLQLVTVTGKYGAQFLIDGTRRDARVGFFTDEGLLLEKVTPDSVSFRFNGLPQQLQLNQVAVLDSQSQGYPSHQIRADQKNKYLTPALVNGGNLLAEIDRTADIIVIPVADADRLGLPYKDKPSRSNKIPVERSDAKAGKESGDAAPGPARATDGKSGKDGTYKTYSIELNSVRIGNVDVYGLRAVVSEEPGLTTTVIGRDFLKRLAPSWSNRTLTLVRR
jgi:predicted aspartyl protease